MAMATRAAFHRTRRLFSILSSSATPCVRPPSLAPEPAPVQEAAAGEAEAKPKAGRKRRNRLGKILRAVSDERDPDKLVSQFIAASTAYPGFRDNWPVYEVAVRRLASFGRRDAVAALLDSQKPFLEASSEDFALRILGLYRRASMPSHAAATFLALPPKHKSVAAFNALLAAYFHTGDFDSLAAAFDETPASQKAEPSAALVVISLMEKCGLKPDLVSFNSLLNGLYNNGRFDEAEKIWEMMKERNLQPDAKSYNAKLRGLVAAGRIEDAVAVLEGMQRDGPKPDLVSYNELIRGYCKEGRLDGSKKLYDDLVKNGYALNKSTFETLIPCLLEAGELDLALNCCQETLSRKCRVKCSLLQAVVTALVAASRVEEATRIVKLGRKNNYPPSHLNTEADCNNTSPAHRLSSIFPSIKPRAGPPKPALEPAQAPKAPAGKAGAKPKERRESLKQILKAVYRQRDPDKLVSQFIAASTASPRFRDNRRVYEAAVCRLVDFGRRDAVAALLDSQRPFLEASSEDFAMRILRLYSHASMPSHAAATFIALPPKHKSVAAFNALLAAYVRTGDFDSLTAAFDEILASQKAGPSAALDVISVMEKCGLTPDMVSFNTLLSGFYDNGRFDEAEKIWKMMKERNLQPNVKSYNAKLRGLVAAGRIEDAVAVLEGMQRDGPKPDSVSYNELIRGYCKEGRLDGSKKLYDDLVKNGYALYKGTFETLMPCLLEAGELDLALNCCQETLSRKCRVKCSLLQAVVTALVAASRVEEAARIVKLGWKNNYPPSHLNTEADCNNASPVRRLSSIFSSTKPRAQPPKSKSHQEAAV